jgi:hypothetical protein
MTVNHIELHEALLQGNPLWKIVVATGGRLWGGVRMIKINLYSVIIHWHEYIKESNFIGERLRKQLEKYYTKINRD